MKKKVNRLWRKVLKKKNERGSALIIVTLILALLTIYISAALTTTTTDAISSNFSIQQQRAFFGAYSKMEQMTGDFSTLFLTSLNPTYDSMCKAVIADPSTIKNLTTNQDEFSLNLPNVNCPTGGDCTPSYSGKFVKGTDLFDLGWEGDPIPAGGYCLVDVCNPDATPACGFPLRPTRSVSIQTGDYAGLQGFGRRFRMVATASSANLGGADVQVTRDFTNYLLPVFQFGIFTDADFELYIPPLWTFGGWVHTNSDFYATGNTCKDSNGNNIPCNVFSQYTYDSNNKLAKIAGRITIGRHMIIGNEKGGDNYGGKIRVYTTGTDFKDIDQGTVHITGANQGGNVSTVNCSNVGTVSQDAAPGNCSDPPYYGEPNGVVKIGVRPLKLPIQNLLGANPIEIIRRGLPSDFAPAVSSPLIAARYYYKPGLRITLADYQNQLPRQVLVGNSPSNGTGPYGGIQLDGPDNWLGDNVGSGTQLASSSTGSNVNWYYKKENLAGGDRYLPIPRGYQPKLTGSASPRPTAARVNGARIHGWIKVEIVQANLLTFDITEEILNLGVTVPYVKYGTSFYYPSSVTASRTFPTAIPVPNTGAGSDGPYPDEHSVIHLQRMAVPYKQGMNSAGIGFTPADITPASLDDVGLDNLTTGNIINFDYYASMNLRDYNDTDVVMYGIEDNSDDRKPVNTYPVYGTRYAGKVVDPPTANSDKPIAPFAEPQPDTGGYYTDAVRVPVPKNYNDLTATKIDFRATSGLTSAPTDRPPERDNYLQTTLSPNKLPLSENANLPKQRGSGTNTSVFSTPESTWQVKDTGGTIHHLVPFPINMYDAREGLPHQPDPTAVDFSDGNMITGLKPSSPNKNGTMNLVEIDMGNLGRLLNGEFDKLFENMTGTAYRTDPTRDGSALKGAHIRDNIDINQDNGWIVYFSDRRGDEPLVSTNKNATLPSATLPSAPTTATMQSIIGDGNYGRENVIWSGGAAAAGSPKGIPAKFGGLSGCDSSKTPYGSDSQDPGKSPQDSNNDCYIQDEETSAEYSETSDYAAMFNDDQYMLPIKQDSGTENLDYSKKNGTNVPSTISLDPAKRAGAMVALTQVGTNRARSWSLKPPVAYRDIAGFTSSNLPLRTELFRRALRLVNAATLFPSGQSSNTACGALLGLTMTSENPVYVFGNYNAPLGSGIDNGDKFPGLTVDPSAAGFKPPTAPNQFNGSSTATSSANIHVPAAIVADAITFLSNPCVGGKNTTWSGTSSGSGAGWVDARSFVSPYQTLAARPARNTVYRFALISGYTPSWYSGYWGNAGWNQGYDSAYSSGALNNFPRFLEDWGQNGDSPQYATYSGSLIRMFKSRQGNGAFKRNASGGATDAGSTAGKFEAVYRPPQRDWVFDLDFTQPCTLPPGTPFLQLIDFKGFQQSVVQQR